MAWQESGCGPHLALGVENNQSVDSKIVEVCIYRVSTVVTLEEGTIQLRVTPRTQGQALMG